MKTIAIICFLALFLSTSYGCSLQTFNSDFIIGNGTEILYEKDFQLALIQMEKFAIDCIVKIYVNHAFRYAEKNSDGSVPPPPVITDHYVGHAIDYSADTPDGWCDGDCVNEGQNIYSECFLKNALQAGMRYEYFPSDPVHLDDGLSLSDPAKFNSLYYQLQAEC